MKLLKTYLFFTSLILVISCKKEKQQNGNNVLGFAIKGTTTNDYNDYLYLNYGNIIDSTLVKNNSFQFTGSVNHITEARLFIKDKKTGGASMYLGNEEMDLSVAVYNNNAGLVEIESLEGNKTTSILSDLEIFYEENLDKDNFSALFYNKLDSVFIKNPKSEFSGDLFEDVILDPIFSFQEAMSLYSKIDTTTQRSETINAIKVSLENLKIDRIGTKFESFSLPDKDGNILNLENFNTNYLLVEFWASWCQSCRDTNPDLVKIYENYNGKGFDILGVSIDKNKTSWLNAITKDGLTWTQAIAEDGYDDPILKKLKIQYMPSNYLVDKDRNILAINVHPRILEKKLQELLP